MKTFKHLLLTTTLIAASTAVFAQNTTVIIKTDSSVSTTRYHKSTNRVTSDFSMYIGLNNFGGAMPAGYDFRPLGSRFVALAWQKRIPLSVKGATKLRLVTGPEVAWNNFMFERSADAGRNILVERNNQLSIEQSDVDLHKSKLVMAQLNLPVMFNVSFRSGLTLGLGAYAGIRLDSYTKVKPVGGSTVRDHGSYNLNTVRWGLTSELGFRGSAKLFFRYEPNSPFKAGQGPDASVWAVGLKL
ncbi:outer membrane beta-barrel protein [Spirosoma fluviale]|uniref:Outer membrane protein beta-barrel domain-containing protein n=1 Tax=Spirosoma fluviale TaxID=1597977 RepID=A0A286F8N8_9BACT|nr:outer membrane beta-barrel protein [Spirosoma fluviale]SOD79234.1 Outer membrane protein beta-barrel domain-containing protein [Spirosoma fluviale]